MTSRDRWLLPDGIDELLPQQARMAEKARRKVIDLFGSWGYQLVMPPLVEFADSLLVGVGEDLANHSFRLTDQISGRLLAIRPDITAQVARLDAHSMKAKGVNRLCYAGSVLHAKPKSLAASRCPILAGAEIYGDASIQADVEVVSLMLSALTTIDSVDGGEATTRKAKSLHRLTLDIGHVGIYRAIENELRKRCPEITHEGLAQLFDAVQRKSRPDLQSIVPALVNDKLMAELLTALPGWCGDVSTVTKARASLEKLNDDSLLVALEQVEFLANVVTQRFPDVNVYFDLAELRGYDYHTGLVFAAYASDFGVALANGGRYDELGQVFGSARPATGFNTDVKALVQLMPIESTSADDVVAAPAILDNEPDEAGAALWKVVCELRASGETVVFASEEDYASYARKVIFKNGHWLVQ